ncbi:hypothetical protein ACJX0J_042320, partial [Zea mays]
DPSFRTNNLIYQLPVDANWFSALLGVSLEVKLNLCLGVLNIIKNQDNQTQKGKDWIKAKVTLIQGRFDRAAGRFSSREEEEKKLRKYYVKCYILQKPHEPSAYQLYFTKIKKDENS